MTRYVFITGGVVSSLGKGLASAALGALLRARGHKVRLRKLDPYLNVDPGTMSPIEHGEVFVTDDGAETDLDIGHYERFTGVPARATDSVSAGRIYSNVLERERSGSYLGKTIQVVPHVTNEIKDFIRNGDDKVDFMLCEIGGTVGDIEGLPFYEAIRQFSHDQPRGECIFMHLTLLPYLTASGELKTKPTQHSVKELQSIGIAPDVLVCRCKKEIPASEREKIALFCNVRSDAVIAAKDLRSIYEAPLAYHREGLDRAVLDAFGIDLIGKPDLAKWNEVSNSIKNTNGSVRIAVVGKYIKLEDAYKSIREALTHGGISNRVRVKVKMIDSEKLEHGNIESHLKGVHAILVPGGFGKRGIKGKIKAAQFARENLIPYFGICLGMQVAVLEVLHNLANMPEAISAEFGSLDNHKNPTDTDTKIDKDARIVNRIKKFKKSNDYMRQYHIDNVPKSIVVIYRMTEWKHGDRRIRRCHKDGKGATMRLGSYVAKLSRDSKVAEIYNSASVEERHRHRYEVEISYRKKLRNHGLYISGTSPDRRLPEIIERRQDHPWFIGVQFHPELKSRPFNPHPLFADFIRAAIEYSKQQNKVVKSVEYLSSPLNEHGSTNFQSLGSAKDKSAKSQ